MTWSGRRIAIAACFVSWGILGTFAACTDSYGGGGGQTSTGTGPGGAGSTGGSGGSSGTMGLDASGCPSTCSNDLKHIVDCTGTILESCTPDEGCANAACIADPCLAAETSKSSYGCDYFALKTALRPQADGACFAAFVANTWAKPVKITVDRGGQSLMTQNFAYIPQGQGQQISYTPYDPNVGLGVGEVAVLFLSRSFTGGSVVNCPMPAALPQETGVPGTGRGEAFHIRTDYPVVAYQIVPYGGGQAQVTSATLLLPTSAWDVNYIAINAYKQSAVIPDGYPSLNILAHQDQTEVKVLPKAAIVGGPNVMPSPANTQVTYTLNAGEYIQITQAEELTGSILESTKPIAVFGASTCMNVPDSEPDCDSAQQQIAPVQALGNEYAAVRHQDRGSQPESPPWRLVGAVDDTMFTWEPSAPTGAPTTIKKGEVIEFNAEGPFVVRSQDLDHPFYLGGYMTGGLAVSGRGDPDWVNVIPPSQYLNSYVMFTDPTYPETSLVVIRTPSKVDNSFADVTLNCRGTLTGWQPFGKYEYTHVSLVTGNFVDVSGCSNGRHEMSSALPFGVTIWGWGTTQQTQLVSYAYPAGAGFKPVNEVVIPPNPF
jgi:hypothetical protein